MMALAAAGLLLGAAIISAFVDWALGLDNDGMVYDIRTERWMFVPSRYDTVLEMIIRS